MKENSVLEMKNIYKSFPGVKALQAVDFTLCEGEIHALMGENGAGKSTLIKVLTGVYEKDGGDIFLKEHEGAVAIRSPQDAQNLGISTVYQEITLCPNLSVAENMYIGRGKGIGQNWNYDGQCNPYQASYIEDVIKKLESGEKIDEKTIIMDEKGFDATTITQDDVDQFGI